MRSFFSGMVSIMGMGLVGHCLAYPMKLSDYFYDKAELDQGLFLILFLISFYMSKRFVQSEKWKAFSLALIPLTLIWFKLEYEIYSWLYSPQFVTYGLILLLGLSASQLIKFPILKDGTNRGQWITIPFFIAGFLISFFSKTHDFSETMTLYFSFCLTMAYWEKYKLLSTAIIVSTLGLMILGFQFKDPIFLESQKKYHDKVVFSEQTDFQTIDVTEWKGNHWFYQNGVNHFSSIDHWLYFEPFVYPARVLNPNAKVLVIGGENGMLVNQLRKSGLKKIQLLTIDEGLLDIAASNEAFIAQNEDVFSAGVAQVRNAEPLDWLAKSSDTYDLIFIDAPDPVDVLTNQFYTKEFYGLCHKRLNEKGLLITQSGSPYFATEAFDCIKRTIESSGFDALSYHNQVLTLGEWSWTIGAKGMNQAEMKAILTQVEFDAFETQWINQEAMQMMISFGKPVAQTSNVEVNEVGNPVLFKYYLKGNYTLR